MAANNISTLPFKRDRQDATQLPTRYAVGDNNTIVDNPNPGGLLLGRLWA